MIQRVNQHQGHLRAQQAYLQLLRTEGIVPSSQPRPDFDGLEATVQLIEDVARKSDGNVRAIDCTIMTLAGKVPALAALLDTQENGHTAVEVISDEILVPPLPDGVAFSPEVSQSACRWLDHYETYSRAVSPEGYDDFHVACGLWVLSTVAARRVYVPLSKRVYTPLAIALTARTSLFAKTTTASAAITVLQRAGLAFLLGDDETTPQKLLADMAGCLPASYGDLDEEQQARIKLRVAMSG